LHVLFLLPKHTLEASTNHAIATSLGRGGGEDEEELEPDQQFTCKVLLDPTVAASRVDNVVEHPMIGMVLCEKLLLGSFYKL
jgi:hypothetical protein